MNDCILLRYGEIGLKSKRTRPYFEKLFLEGVKSSLKRIGIEELKIECFGGRFVVYCKNIDEVCRVLSRVAGIQSLSPAKKITFSSKKDLTEKIKKITKNLVCKKTFAVRVRRIGKHQFSSTDIAKTVGSSLIRKSKGVDLTKPEISIHLEIRDFDCFVYIEKISGVGGLPIGTSGEVLCLFSGGIDSPVAAYEMMKRGCKVDFLFLNIIGEKLMFDVSKVYNFLIARYTFTYTPKMFIIDGKEIIESIKNEVPDNLRQIAYKIVLYKISELIAQKNNYLALVSGESIAQKSSQTLKSLLFIEKQISITMLRPLLSFDKIEITDKARQIGTFSSSEKIKEYCDLSEGPVTTAPHELDMKKIPSFKKEIDKGVKNVLIKKGVLMIKDTKQINIPFNSKIVSIDIRPSTKQKNNPIKTDKQMSYSKALKNLDFFQKEKIYLIVCEFGVLSENLSFEIKKRGVKAIGLSVNAFKNYSKKN